MIAALLILVGATLAVISGIAIYATLWAENLTLNLCCWVGALAGAVLIGMGLIVAWPG